MPYSYSSGGTHALDNEDQREFKELWPYVLPQVPTCSNMMATQQLERAARELCQKARIWRVTQTPLPINGSDCEYEFEPYDNADRVQIEWATYGGRQIKPTTEQQLFKCDKEWMTRRGHPTHYLEMNSGMIRVWPTPDESVVPGVPGMSSGGTEPTPEDAAAECMLIFRISMKPALGATAMDRQILDDFYDTIINGALAYLMFMPGKPWSAPDLAAVYSSTFHEGMDRARRQAIDGNVQPDRQMAYGGL